MRVVCCEKMLGGLYVCVSTEKKAYYCMKSNSDLLEDKHVMEIKVILTKTLFRHDRATIPSET